ncbi:MAG: tetratricopeptide repeat protein [Cyanobacteria bacterium P01_H01_bin.74]
MRQTKKQWLSLALAISVSAGLFALPSPEAAARSYSGSAKYSRQIDLKHQGLQTGKFKSAERYYTNLLNRNPGNTKVRSSLAFAQASLYKLGAAEKNADMVLAKDPNNAMAHMVMGIVYRNRTASHDMTYKNNRMNLFQQSVQALQRAANLDPNSPEVLNELGTTYRFMGRDNEALQAFEQALKLDPNMADATMNAGVIYLKNGDVASARGKFQDAIRLNSKNYKAHYWAGSAHLAAGDPHSALESLNTALSLDKGNASVMAKMGEAYQAQGNNAAAIASYRKAIHENPSYMPAYMGISNIFDKRGDGEMAMAELRSALNVNPKYNDARNRLGRLALSVDKPDQALEYYRAALKVNPQDPDAINGISHALTVIAQRQAAWSQTVGADSDLINAEQSIQEALRMNPNDMRLHLAHLRISRLSGKSRISNAELERLVAVPPQNDIESMIQGEAYMAMGKYAQADDIFSNLVQKNAAQPDNLLILGDTLKINGNLSGAEQAYNAVLVSDPGNLKATRGIERIEYAQKESERVSRRADALDSFLLGGPGKESAIDYYEEALQKNPRQPEKRLQLSKLYEKVDAYEKAAVSYQFYLNLNPGLTDKKREKYQKKISKLRTKAQKQATKQGTALQYGNSFY